MALQNFDPEDFLQHYWQKKPLLIRQGLPDYPCPLDGDDLAGLACEDETESRLILGDLNHWQLRRGPFKERQFSTLPAHNWTLLLQRVDHWIPEVADLASHFRFIPRWRLEDIMVSYATDGGNVGPHFDQYDVFLVQGQGRRRWHLGGACNDDTALLPHTDLRLLANFEAKEEYLLDAGDILYIPPGIAHWGIAEGDNCITLSVGFRAPSQAEMLADFADHFASEAGHTRRYQDPDHSATNLPGYLSPASVEAARAQMLAALGEEQDIARWFGEMMTRNAEPSSPHPPLSIGEFTSALNADTVVLALGARLAFNDDFLFADGQSYPLRAEDSATVARFCQLESGETILSALLSPGMLYELYRAGTVCVDED